MKKISFPWSSKHGSVELQNAFRHRLRGVPQFSPHATPRDSPIPRSRLRNAVASLFASAAKKRARDSNGSHPESTRRGSARRTLEALFEIVPRRAKVPRAETTLAQAPQRRRAQCTPAPYEAIAWRLPLSTPWSPAVTSWFLWGGAVVVPGLSAVISHECSGRSAVRSLPDRRNHGRNGGPSNHDVTHRPR
jgi:hypothetical protein